MGKVLLVIDDSRDILQVLKESLERQGYVVLVADNASEALLLVKEAHPDLILSDVMMPGLNGRSFCRILRESPSTRSTPVILMSGVSTREAEVLLGYEDGAVDYLAKPLSMKLLLAKIKALLRNHSDRDDPAELVRFSGITLSLSARWARLRGRKIRLAPREFDLLAALLRQAGRVLSVVSLLETVWRQDPAEYNDPRSIAVHISRLRRKLGAKLSKRIITVAGHGYMFEP